jgi:hypothetical protein
LSSRIWDNGDPRPDWEGCFIDPQSQTRAELGAKLENISSFQEPMFVCSDHFSFDEDPFAPLVRSCTNMESLAGWINVFGFGDRSALDLFPSSKEAFEDFVLEDWSRYTVSTLGSIARKFKDEPNRDAILNLTARALGFEIRPVATSAGELAQNIAFNREIAFLAALGAQPYQLFNYALGSEVFHRDRVIDTIDFNRLDNPQGESYDANIFKVNYRRYLRFVIDLLLNTQNYEDRKFFLKQTEILPEAFYPDSTGYIPTSWILKNERPIIGFNLSEMTSSLDFDQAKIAAAQQYLYQRLEGYLLTSEADLDWYPVYLARVYNLIDFLETRLYKDSEKNLSSSDLIRLALVYMGVFFTYDLFEAHTLRPEDFQETFYESGINPNLDPEFYLLGKVPILVANGLDPSGIQKYIYSVMDGETTPKPGIDGIGYGTYRRLNVNDTFIYYYLEQILRWLQIDFEDSDVENIFNVVEGERIRLGV